MTPNAFGVRTEGAGGRWEVLIVDPAGRPVHRRACSGETEARTFASTVTQHISWLSEDMFRSYYRLSDEAATAPAESAEA